MVFCRSCNSSVRPEESSMLQTHGKCTRCYLRALPPPPAPMLSLAEQQLSAIGGPAVEFSEIRPECVTLAVLDEAAREAELVHTILIGIPSVEEQRERMDAFETADPQPRTLTLPESLKWQEEHGLIDRVSAAGR